MAASPLKLNIKGMDCGGCALKIETAIGRLPGVDGIDVNFGASSLSLTLDETRTPRDAILAKIVALGFTPVDPALDARPGPGRDEVERDHGGHDHGAHGHDPAGRSWWSTPNGRLVLGTGALLALAFAASRVAPAWGHWTYVAATAPGLVVLGGRALAGVRAGVPFSIETLMSVAVFGALAIGDAAEAAAVVLLFALGELLESVAARRARAGVAALMDLAPRSARRVRGDDSETVPVDQLRVGDLVIVRPGGRVPSDGVVVAGASEVNEAALTGESVPVVKSVDAEVHAGGVNGNGELRVRITRTAADNTIARIIHLVERAQESKAPTARFIDRFSRWYTPAAMVVSLIVMLVPPLLFGADWTTWIYRGLAVLLIACPCALVISTPAAIASGLAAGARRGLLVKGGAALEALGKLRTVAFDKTGTLTRGELRIVDLVAIEGGEAEMLAKAAAVEREANHPLGAAIVASADERGLALPKALGGAVATPGKAVAAQLESGLVSVGSPRAAAEAGSIAPPILRCVEALESEGKTVVAVSESGRLLGLIALRDAPRPDAAAGLERLRKLGVKTVMLTGDNARAAATIAGALGVEARAELLPAAKLAAIADLQREGPIAMVGDGVNDAPALAAASVGVAMGAGADVALETADAALLNNRVAGVAELVALSRATLANIRQNLAVALGFKSVVLVTTLIGATPLLVAILADTGATVLVTANALRLLRFRP